MILICNWQASCRCGLSRGPLWAKPLPAANGSLTESARICRICDTVTILRRICGRCMTLLDVAVASGCIMLHHAAPRIVYLQTPQGGGKTEQEARVQATAIRLNYNAAAFPASKTKAICDHDIICKQLCCIRIILISQCIPIYNYIYSMNKT